eukprot:2541028-Pleurochrysis_carterae.AAC.1
MHTLKHLGLGSSTGNGPPDARETEWVHRLLLVAYARAVKAICPVLERVSVRWRSVRAHGKDRHCVFTARPPPDPQAGMRARAGLRAPLRAR